MSGRTDREDFARKFQIVRDALNLSRTGCARELGVDKSVVSRWASGVSTPTEHNLTRLTATIQRTHPRFLASVWQLDPEAFAAWFQSDEPEEPPTDPASPPASGHARGQPSIAVLAFDNLSGDPADAFFADGMTEDLITELSRSRSMLVIARNSSFTYKGRQVDIRQIGRELGVRYVLEGSIRRSGDRIRITAQLVEAEGGAHVWAERYDRALTDLFATQDEISLAVSRAIEPAVEMAERQRTSRKRPESLDAWEAWQRARSGIEAEDWPAVDTWLRRSMELDPGFASPHASRAYFLWSAATSGRLNFHEGRDLAEAASRHAIRLDPDDSFGYATLALCRDGVRDWAGGLHNARRALELAPNSQRPHGAMTFTLAAIGRFDEAAYHLELARKLNPRGTGRRLNLVLSAHLEFLRGDYERSAMAAETLIAASPDNANPYSWILPASLAYLGRQDEASAALARWLAASPRQAAQFAALGVSWTAPEDSDRAMAGLRMAGWKG